MSVRTPGLDRDLIRLALGPDMPGVPIYVYDRVRSTNDTAQQMMMNHPVEPFFAVLAEQQDGGRGRRGRSWLSPTGAGLLFSVAVAYPQYPYPRLEEWPLLAALSARLALAEGTGLSIGIKWPNDLLIAQRKVCGILTEMGTGNIGRFLVIGIGVNVNTDMSDLPPEIQEKATSLRQETSCLFDRNTLAGLMIRHLHMAYVGTLHGHGLQKRHQEWLIHCVTIGRYVRVAQGSRVIEGVAETVDERGTLHLIGNDGARHAVISGEIIESFSV